MSSCKTDCGCACHVKKEKVDSHPPHKYGEGYIWTEREVRKHVYVCLMPGCRNRKEVKL